MVTSGRFCWCNCCLGGERDSWCFLLCHLPRSPLPNYFLSHCCVFIQFLVLSYFVGILNMYWLGQNVHSFLSVRWLQWHLVVFNFIRNNFVRLYCDSSHISVHLKRNLSKLVNFCVAILILKMEGKKQHFQHIMLYYFKKGKNATETQKKICAVYGESAGTDQTCQKWFAKFCAGDFSLDIAPRWGRPVEVDSNQTETLIENNQCYTMREIADILKISKSSVENHLHQLGYVNHFDVWVPHKLREKNLLGCISAWNSLLKCNKKVLFLKQIVTGDEKWIVYNNVEWKRSWGKQNEPPATTPKSSLHPKNVMLCIWWDWKGVLYYELLLENQMINSNKYCSQLEQLKAALDEKHPEVVNRKHKIFHQDNARPHVSLMTKQKLLQLGWEVLIHPLYSPDIAPSDFHLFQSLQNSLIGKNFNSPEDCKRHLDQFFAQKIKMFWEDGIMKLPGKWQKVVGKRVNTLCNKVLGKNEKCVFCFYLKTEGTFWPTQQKLQYQ